MPGPIPTESENSLRELRRRLQFWLVALLSIIGLGTIGYHAIEHTDWLTSFYQTVCILTTLGLPALPRTEGGLAFSAVLAIGGIGSFAYVAGALVQLIAAGDMQRAISRRRVLKRMDKLSDHFIICGFGRIGEKVGHQMRAQNLPFVVIERDEAVESRIEEEGFYSLRGDAASDDVLLSAGIERARGLVVVTNSDAENVLITMTARQLNKQIPIVVRCDKESNAPKFVRAGATRVITPYTTGAHQIALAATKPHVIDLFEVAASSGHPEFELREVGVPDGSPAHGRTLSELSLNRRFGVIVIGIKPSEEAKMRFNPSAESQLRGGDVIVAVGHNDRFAELERFLGG